MQVPYALVIAVFYLLVPVFAFDLVIGSSRILYLALVVNLGTAVGLGPGRGIDTESVPSSDLEACTFASAFASPWAFA